MVCVFGNRSRNVVAGDGNDAAENCAAISGVRRDLRPCRDVDEEALRSVTARPASAGLGGGARPSFSVAANMATFSHWVWVVVWTQFVLFLTLLSPVNGQRVLCPLGCSCLGSFVDCSRRGLTKIPTDLPTWVEIL